MVLRHVIRHHDNLHAGLPPALHLRLQTQPNPLLHPNRQPHRFHLLRRYLPVRLRPVQPEILVLCVRKCAERHNPEGLPRDELSQLLAAGDRFEYY